MPDRVVGVSSMDPTRPDGVPSAENQFKDPTIVYGVAPDVPYCASYNAELFKYIDPKSSMAARLKRMFPRLGDDSPLETRRKLSGDVGADRR